MKKTINLTQKQTLALQLINESKANIWSHPKGARGGKHAGLSNICEYCGKKCKEDNGQLFGILTSGAIIPNRISEATVWQLNKLNLTDQPQGAFLIHNTCAEILLGDELQNYLAF
jgi:hypothetical protein